MCMRRKQHELRSERREILYIVTKRMKCRERQWSTPHSLPIKMTLHVNKWVWIRMEGGKKKSAYLFFITSISRLCVTKSIMTANFTSPVSRTVWFVLVIYFQVIKDKNMIISWLVKCTSRTLKDIEKERALRFLSFQCFPVKELSYCDGQSWAPRKKILETRHRCSHFFLISKYCCRQRVFH